jgi:nitrate reductase cytochrome c-type subunit
MPLLAAEGVEKIDMDDSDRPRATKLDVSDVTRYACQQCHFCQAFIIHSSEMAMRRSS